MESSCENCKHVTKQETESPCCDCMNCYVPNTAEYYEHKLMFEPASDKWATKSDEKVDHPAHYNNGEIECIDAMLSAYGKDSVQHFCLLNAFKYLWRSEHKNGKEDLDKAIWYIRKYLELEESNERTEQNL